MTMVSSPLPVLTARRAFNEGAKCWEQHLVFESYVRSRERYKDDLVDALSQVTQPGPWLEVSGGYSSIGATLAKRCGRAIYTLYHSPDTGLLCLERRERENLSPASYCPTALLPEEAVFGLVYSVNALHEWSDAGHMIKALYDRLLPGGQLVINDLRRDANPFITEYILREMSLEETEIGREHLMIFLNSLASSYTFAELDELLGELGLFSWSIEDSEPMTLTATINAEAVR